MKRPVTLGLTALGLVAIALAAWWFVSAPPLVSLARPQRGPAVDAIYATGTVEPVRWAKIASTETGRILDYPATERRAVAKGDLLVHLDDAEAKADLREATARVAFLKGDLERYAALVERSTVSRQAYERVQSDLDQALAATAAARQRLADLTISAPLDGVVLRKDGEVGEVVQAGDVLLWIGQDRPYWITADVDEEDIPWVEPGQRSLIKADAFPKRALEGRVSEITPMGDSVNKQYRVRVLLPADSPLLIGMTTELNIIVRTEENALLIPEGAVAGNDFVWLFDDGKARRQVVELGIYGKGLVEVRGGLTDSDQLILDPPGDLQYGQTVRVRRR
ncbi:efflux RND transporter periplasmic adaptor subunit [Pelagibius litoralis]|uniref:Efflux RND transporter periplasmic adaptor subunit n=1 Tax=Pelagibius litoralis TaxID=374515 RepID=A0A967C861_9PROT|nr:efflux RND transporter periplasmic adaptor subunit [Pelagibius litoralis]NIA68182.1 efflux RND transporter periplasmic adaptor subunit [Pelagibius litoralis]